MQDVVKEQVNVPENQADTTTIDFGQAEPGRDIFVDKKGAKSDARVAVKEPEEPKIELSLEALSTTESTQPQTEATDVVVDEEVEGPSSEDDAEAERARQELFGEADDV